MKPNRLPWIAAAATATLVLWAAPARATDVNWSVGINAPVGPGVSVGTVISNRHVAPVVVAPAPVVYAPAPVIYRPAPVVYTPAPVHVPSRVVYGAPVWAAGGWVRPVVDDHYRHGTPQWHERGGHDRRDHRPPPQHVPSRYPGREIRY